ncbi:MAG: hypothetical protein Q4A48_03625 [Bacillota bacterium]|nr:hypothetical protein [Bacillota bacterium]
MLKKWIAIILAVMMILSLAACSNGNESASSDQSASGKTEESADKTLSANDIETEKTIKDSSDGGHAITADGKEKTYSKVKVIKTGDSSNEDADFYGDNSAVFATDKGTLDLDNMIINTDGSHANAVFSYGEGTTVNIKDSVIKTSGNCSGGLMTTGGAAMNAENLTVNTSGNSSAAIRSDRGGGTVNVTGGSYTTSGTGSPVIYSTADITVNDASLVSKTSQGVVVEGKNSVTLNGDNLTVNNTKVNGDQTDTHQAVMIYQSMSGDAASGTAEFTMKDTNLTNKTGDIFFVNNTVTKINLSNSKIINKDKDGVFLRAEAAGWGNSGSNGGHVTLKAKNQSIEGDMIVDDISTLNLFLSKGSDFTGTINKDGKSGDVYVKLSGGSKWTLTDDAYITSLTCDADSIDLNGHTLYVNGKKYKEGTESEGSKVEVPESAVQSNGGGSTPPDGAGAPPAGGGAPREGGTPPEGSGQPQ